MLLGCDIFNFACCNKFALSNNFIWYPIQKVHVWLLHCASNLSLIQTFCNLMSAWWKNRTSSALNKRNSLLCCHSLCFGVVYKKLISWKVNSSNSAVPLLDNGSYEKWQFISFFWRHRQSLLKVLVSLQSSVLDAFM